MRLAGCPVEKICEAGIEIDLDQDRDGQHCDDQRLRQDLFALESEQKHQRRKQRNKGNRLQCRQQSVKRGIPPLASTLRRTICAMMTGTTM